MIKEEISDLKKTLDNLVEEKKKVVEIVDLLLLDRSVNEIFGIITIY